MDYNFIYQFYLHYTFRICIYEIDWSSVAIEYTDCLSAEGSVPSANKRQAYDTKLLKVCSFPKSGVPLQKYGREKKRSE